VSRPDELWGRVANDDANAGRRPAEAVAEGPNFGEEHGRVGASFAEAVVDVGEVGVQDAGSAAVAGFGQEALDGDGAGVSAHGFAG